MSTNLAKAKEELATAVARRGEIAAQREKREARLRAARKELETEQRKLERWKLVPGTDAAALDRRSNGVAAMAAEVRKLENEEREAAEAVCSAQSVVREEAARLVPAVAKEVLETDDQWVRTLGWLGEEVAEHVYHALAAEAEREEALDKLRGLVDPIRSAGAEGHSQVLELRSHLRNRSPVGDATLLGYLVRLAVAPSRKAGGLQEFWQDAMVGPLDGSAMDGRVEIDAFQLFHLRALPPINL